MKHPSARVLQHNQMQTHIYHSVNREFNAAATAELRHMAAPPAMTPRCQIRRYSPADKVDIGGEISQVQTPTTFIPDDAESYRWHAPQPQQFA